MTTVEAKIVESDGSNAKPAIEADGSVGPTAADTMSLDQGATDLAPPPAALTTRELISMPSDAIVYSESKPIGKTPFVVRWPEGGEPPILKLVRRGFHPATVKMETSSEGISQKVQLRPLQRIIKPRGKSAKPPKGKTQYKMID
jgi:hypothetical protein